MSEFMNPLHNLSNRGNVEPFHAMDVLARANQLANIGRDIAYLCVGQPSAPAPKAALEAAGNALSGGVLGYTDAAGKYDLRQRLARHYLETYGCGISAEQIFITTGSSAGFNLAFLTLFDAGDRVAIAAPGYPAYRNIMKALGLEVVEIEVTAATRWALTPAHLEQAHAEAPLAGVLIASPGNPTGTMMGADDLRSVCDWCRNLGIRLISDEIYHGLVYPEASGIAQHSALEFDDTAIIINSFSKYFCMTGWRIGWMVLPPQLVRSVERLAQSMYISAPELSQIAALHALDGTEELEAVRQSYSANRDLLLKRLPTLGFSEVLPIDGAFYAYADASSLTNDTMDFAYRAIDEAGVAITPGLDFDTERGHKFVRLSFAGHRQTIETALTRLEEWLSR